MSRILQFLILLELGVTWSLELSSAPLHPANPYPPHLATNIPANADLTWTPGDTELIRNGGFETGNAAGWVRVNQGQGSQNNTYITNASYVPVSGEPSYPPFAGNFCALTDQDGPGLISMYQDVLIPASAGSVQFTWADRMRNYFNTFVSEPPPLRQEYRVEIRATDDSVLAVAYRTEPDDPVRTLWAKRNFDLTPFKGQVVRIVFLQEQYRSFFHLYYDNVSVRVRDPGAVAYDVYFGTNAVPGANQFRGTVSTGSWPLPQLLPQQTYFWRVDARMGADIFVGPVWRFTTAAVGPLDHFTWEPVPSPQSVGAPFSVSLTAQDAADNPVTNFSGTAMIDASSVESITTNSLQGDVVPSGFAAFENSTVGYSFTPNADLLVIGFSHYAGGKASLWTDDGILLGSEPANAPIQLFAGRTYRLGLYSPGIATNYVRFDGLSTFPHGTLNQAYEGTGDAFPTSPHPARWWLVDLIYAAPTVSSTVYFSEPISFTGISWTGSVSVLEPALVRLRAYDESGHLGVANLFTVADNFRLEILRNLAGELILRFPTSAGRDYLLETSTTLAPNSWSPFGSAISGTGGTIERPVTATGAAAFFRLQRVP